jgi:hypothetical protein
MITIEELNYQAESLAKHAGLHTPQSIGCAVIFLNRESKQFTMRAVKMSKEEIRHILDQLHEGYGVQKITEGVDRG